MTGASLKGVPKSPEHRAHIAAALRAKPTPEFKTCNACKLSKPVAMFPTRRNGRPDSYCEVCVGPTRREQARRSWTKHYRQMGPKRAARSQQYRRAQLLRDYGITLETYDAMLAAQGGRCAICASQAPRGNPRAFSGDEVFAVDHDHRTGEVRGLLCNPCNRALGLFAEDAERLDAAANYLRFHFTKHPCQ